VRVAHGPQVGRSDGWPPRREAYRTPPTGRLTTTFVDSHHPRGWETPPAFVRSAALHTTSPGRAAGAEPAQTENAPVHALPYEEDPDRSWVAPAAPGLPYDGTVPPDVERRGAAQAPVNALRHGQVGWADLDKIRPVVVLTRARVEPRLRRVLVAPVTTTARGIATEVRLGHEAGVRDGSVANLDNIQLVPVECLLRPTGRVAAETWPRFCRAMAAVMGC
jgi:mRNA interferase MazF